MSFLFIFPRVVQVPSEYKHGFLVREVARYNAKHERLRDITQNMRGCVMIQLILLKMLILKHMRGIKTLFKLHRDTLEFNLIKDSFKLKELNSPFIIHHTQKSCKTQIKRQFWKFR